MSTKTRKTPGITPVESRCFQALASEPESWMLAITIRRKANVSEGAAHLYLAQFTEQGICERANSKPPHYRLSAPTSEEGKAYLASLKQSAEFFPLEGVSE